LGSAPPARPPKLLDQVCHALRLRHYSYRTEQAYTAWIRRFILFHRKRHPREMGRVEIEAFLSALAVERRVAASTQNQALAALLFLYRDVLEIEVAWLVDLVRAKRPQRLPVVLSTDEVARVLAALSGVPWLMAMVLYGGGLRLMECHRLRVKDVDCERGEIVVRAGKGGKDRVTTLPACLRTPLIEHLVRVRARHDRHVAEGFGNVLLPNAIAAKYANAAPEWERRRQKCAVPHGSMSTVAPGRVVMTRANCARVRR
jgi:integron integrase